MSLLSRRELKLVSRALFSRCVRNTLLADADYSFLYLRWQSIIIGDDDNVGVVRVCPAQVQFKSKVSILGSRLDLIMATHRVFMTFISLSIFPSRRAPSMSYRRTKSLRYRTIADNPCAPPRNSLYMLLAVLLKPNRRFSMGSRYS